MDSSYVMIRRRRFRRRRRCRRRRIIEQTRNQKNERSRHPAVKNS